MVKDEYKQTSNRLLIEDIFLIIMFDGVFKKFKRLNIGKLHA
jgi:hypothetical protein